MRMLCGAEHTANFAIVDLGQVLFVFTVYKALLAGKGGLKDVVHEAVTSPTVWAIIAGLIVGISGLYSALKPSGVSNIVDAITSFIAAPTSAIILLAIGYDLVFTEVRWKQTLSLVGLRLVVSAIVLGLLLVVNKLLGNIMHTGALWMMLILPPPYVLPIFADVEEERADISSALSLLTLISILLYVVLIALAVFTLYFVFRIRIFRHHEITTIEYSAVPHRSCRILRLAVRKSQRQDNQSSVQSHHRTKCRSQCSKNLRGLRNSNSCCRKV